MLERYKAKRRLNKAGLDYIEVSEGALKHYMNDIKGNDSEKITNLLIKINRNYSCSNVTREFPNTIVKTYGNLVIRYSKKTNKICNIYNRKGEGRNFHVDKELKKRYDKVLNDKGGLLCYI